MSGGKAFVAVVQAADLGESDDLAATGRLDRTPVRAILGERKMCPGPMIVVDVGGENSTQVSHVEDDDVIETFAADRADKALDIGGLPG